MTTLYVDERTGAVWASGEVKNIQNLTAVTISAVS
jgi:hypothetical protein